MLFEARNPYDPKMHESLSYPKVNNSRLHGECIAIRKLEISTIKLLQLPG